MEEVKLLQSLINQSKYASVKYCQSGARNVVSVARHVEYFKAILLSETLFSVDKMHLQKICVPEVELSEQSSTSIVSVK